MTVTHLVQHQENKCREDKMYATWKPCELIKITKNDKAHVRFYVNGIIRERYVDVSMVKPMQGGRKLSKKYGRDIGDSEDKEWDENNCIIIPQGSDKKKNRLKFIKLLQKFK